MSLETLFSVLTGHSLTFLLWLGLEIFKVSFEIDHTCCFMLFFTCVPGYFVCMYVCTSYAFSAHGGQKSVLGTLELELQTALSNHEGAGNKTHAFWKSSCYPQPLNHPYSLHTMIIHLMYAACMMNNNFPYVQVNMGAYFDKIILHF